MKKKRLIAFPFLFIIFLLDATAPFAQETATGDEGIIAAPLANVHAEPVPRSKLSTQVLMGEDVRILDKQDNRYRVIIPGQGGVDGWVQQEAVLLPKEGGHSYLDSERPWIVVAAPKTEALILDRTGNHKAPLYGGTRLPVLERMTKEFKVQFPDKSIALIDAGDVMPIKSADPILNATSPGEIARTAERFRGVRFLAGGMSAQGIDAAGLISVVYRIHGFPLGREIAGFESHAERIDKKKSLETGDILVFNGGQAGLYLGGGRFLESGRKGGVRIANIADRRFAGSFQYGLRIIGADPGGNKRPAEMSADEILLAQASVSQHPTGGRIAYWAGRFIGTPYDPDPLGLYVRTNRIVADEKADCMYHVFRSVELAESATPGEAINRALSLRFRTQGALADGMVTNYDDRFQYGEDMVFSGKWGRNITGELGVAASIPGSRGRETVEILPKKVLLTGALRKKLADGDILFWVKDPKKRAVEEIVAHLSIVHIKANKVFIIHAAGDKDRPGRPGGGVVKEVPFSEYVRNMRFVGAFVTRIGQEETGEARGMQQGARDGERTSLLDPQ